MNSLARRERDALCDLALQVGPDAPTLCAGWDVAGLLTHVHIREHAPQAMLGGTAQERAVARRRTWPFSVLVAQVRRPAFLLRVLPGLDAVVNGAELFIHHEDIRRGQPDWKPRDLTPVTRDEVWKAARQMGTFVRRKLPVPVVISDGTGQAATVKPGDDPVVVTGEPAELLLFLTGRSAHLPLTFDGPPESVQRLQESTRRI